MFWTAEVLQASPLLSPHVAALLFDMWSTYVADFVATTDVHAVTSWRHGYILPLLNKSVTIAHLTVIVPET